MAKKRKKEQVMVEEHTATEATVAVEDTPAVSEPGLVTEATPEIAAEPAEVGVDLAAELEQARQEAAANKDAWQRLAAELANFKRRQEEQMKLQRDMIKADVLQGVISALDDMDLAFQNVPPQLNGQLIGWVEGFRLVQRKLDRVLDDQAVTPIDTSGHFDPNLHEAVSYEESDGHEEGQIIAELRRGYQIGNRVIRPALVRVAKSPASN